jgi:hypothetical protein
MTRSQNILSKKLFIGVYDWKKSIPT